MNRWLRVRLLVDPVLAALVGLLAAPVIAVFAVLVRREDGGPGLITVPRVGRDGREFGMWKLRSMRAAQPDGSAGGHALTTHHDPRITKIGRRLRFFHLDELPQIFNVVRGEMLLLGPRPEAPEFVDPASADWDAVLGVPPGIAGPTQVIVGDWERTLITADPACYADTILPVKLAIDKWYLANSSPVTDLLVIVTLARRYLPGTGSWTLKQRVSRDVPEARVAVGKKPVGVHATA